MQAGATGTRSSLIVLNYEGQEIIGDCITSLLAAKGPDDELIVVDNGSQDDSLSIIAGFGDQVRLVALPENTYIFGLNAGLAAARGRYVAFLNNDMTVEPTFVDRCVAALEDGADDVFAACPRILEAATGNDQGSRTAGRWRRGLLYYETLTHVDAVTDCFFAVGGQSFFKRSYLEDIGSIDPLLWPMYHEDLELSYRAWKRGWRVVYVPDAVAVHLGSHTSRRVFTPVQLRSFVRQNELLITWKDVTDRKLLAEHVLYLLPRLAVAVAKRDRGTVVGYRRAFARLPRALRARRAARQHFRLTDAEVLAAIGAIT